MAGDRLIGQDGQLRTLLRTEQHYDSEFRVCNLTISECHTFAVGPDAVLVHNTPGCFDDNIARHVKEGGKHFKGESIDQIKKRIEGVRDNFDDFFDAGGDRRIYRKGDTVLIEDGAGGASIFKPDNARDYFNRFKKTELGL